MLVDWSVLLPPQIHDVEFFPASGSDLMFTLSAVSHGGSHVFWKRKISCSFSRISLCISPGDQSISFRREFGMWKSPWYSLLKTETKMFSTFFFARSLVSLKMRSFSGILCAWRSVQTLMNTCELFSVIHKAPCNLSVSPASSSVGYIEYGVSMLSSGTIIFRVGPLIWSDIRIYVGAFYQ